MKCEVTSVAVSDKVQGSINIEYSACFSMPCRDTVCSLQPKQWPLSAYTQTAIFQLRLRGALVLLHTAGARLRDLHTAGARLRDPGLGERQGAGRILMRRKQLFYGQHTPTGNKTFLRCGPARVCLAAPFSRFLCACVVCARVCFRCGCLFGVCAVVCACVRVPSSPYVRVSVCVSVCPCVRVSADGTSTEFVSNEASPLFKNTRFENVTVRTIVDEVSGCTDTSSCSVAYKCTGCHAAASLGVAVWKGAVHRAPGEGHACPRAVSRMIDRPCVLHGLGCNICHLRPIYPRL